jgi:phosphatidylethanolamine-binding protein (PEBP) family uncharacterized protein
MQWMGVISRVAAALAASMAGSAYAAGVLAVTVEQMPHNSAIAPEYALCVPTAEGKSAPGVNRRPTIAWEGAPKATDSFAVFVMDPDVPADFTDAGKDGKIITEAAARQDFFHYGVVKIPANETQLVGGAADEETATGMPLVNDLGANNYVTPPTAFGGPCPPWNDARLHHYHFIVLALGKDAPVTLPSDQPETAKQVFDRLITSKSLLAKGVAIGTYTLNPALRDAIH